MDQEIVNRLDQQQEMLEKIFRSTERTRKIFTWTVIISVGMIVLPLIGLALVLPGIIGSYAGLL